MDDKMDTALKNKTSFGVEDMIWGEKAWIGAKNIQEAGYEFHLTYLGLDGADLSAKRVGDRIEEGGHDYVTPEEARECYERNLKMLDKNYEQVDFLEIYDNSDLDPQFVASLRKGEIVEVCAGEAPEWVYSRLPNIHDKIEAHQESLNLKEQSTTGQQQNITGDKKTQKEEHQKTPVTNPKPIQRNKGPRF